MKMLVSMILLGAIAAGSAGCSKSKNEEGPRVRQERATAGFNSIELRGNIDVYYSQGALENLSVEGPQNMLAYVDATVTDNILIIQFSNGKTYQGDKSIRIHVTAPSVNRFVLNNSGSIFFLNSISADMLSLINNGSGDISLKNLVTRHCEIYATASGSIKAEGGNTTNEIIKTSGSGDIDVSKVAAQTATAYNMAAGKIQVRASGNLSARIEGSGSIYYWGYPNVTSHISGLGHLVHF